MWHIVVNKVWYSGSHYHTAEVLVLGVFSENRRHGFTHQLICQQQDSLEAKLSAAEVKKIFKTGSEQLHDKDVVVAFGAAPSDLRYPDCTWVNMHKLTHAIYTWCMPWWVTITRWYTHILNPFYESFAIKTKLYCIKLENKQNDYGCRPLQWPTNNKLMDDMVHTHTHVHTYTHMHTHRYRRKHTHKHRHRYTPPDCIIL